MPRYRYDQLMRLGWKVFLPTSLVAVALVAGWRVFGPAMKDPPPSPCMLAARSCRAAPSHARGRHARNYDGSEEAQDKCAADRTGNWTLEGRRQSAMDSTRLFLRGLSEMFQRIGQALKGAALMDFIGRLRASA